MTPEDVLPGRRRPEPVAVPASRRRRIVAVGLVCAALPVLSACGGGGGAGGASAAIRQTSDGRTVVTDALGARLVIDPNGCQSIVPAGGGTPVPVRDGSGRPVCVPSR